MTCTLSSVGLSCILVGLASHAAQAPATGRLDPADAIILQPYLGKVSLADTINAFPTPGGALVPLGELCDYLGFGISVDGEKGRAEGFFISEKRRFTLDLASGEAQVDGKRMPLGGLLAMREGREIFVDARLLEVWFPLSVKVNTKSALLELKAKEKLPVELEWERDGKGGSLSRQAGDPNDQPLGVFKPTPYNFIDVPFVDLSSSWAKNQHGASGQPSLSTQLAGDLLWMSANFYGTRESNGKVRNPNYSLFREDPHAELLGPLHATQVELGNNTQSTSIDLVGSMPRGQGILLDNYPMSYRSKFASRTFQGILEDGWSIELYQNKALLGYQRSRPDGRFEFKDIPLRFGLNQFKLIFHGPFGQVREESYRVDIASDQPPPGTFYYRLMSSKPTAYDQETMLAGQVNPILPERRVNSLAEMEYGISSYLAGNAAISRAATLDGRLHTYEVVGLRSLFSHLSLQGNVAQDVVQDRPPGIAAEGILRTGYEYSTLTAQRSEYRRGYEKLDFQALGGTPQHLRSESRLQWDGSGMLGRTPTNLSLSHQSQRYLEGGGITVDTIRTTFTFPALTVSPSIGRAKDLSPMGTVATNADVFVTFRKGEYDMQSEFGATQVDGKTRINDWGFLANRVLPSGLVFRVGVRGRDPKLQDGQLQLNVSKLTGRVGYGVDFQFAKATGYTLGLRFQASFGREPRTGKWSSDARYMSGQGAVSLVAFKDNNGNQVLDPGEPVYSDTQFKLGNQPIENAIKDSAVVFRPLLPRGQETTIRLSEASLEDPSLQSSVRAYRVVPRPGKVIRLAFPVSVFGEINGTTRIRRDKGTVEFGGLELELLRANGERVKLFRSAYDGFFELRDLPIGDYLLRVSPQEVERLKIQEPPVRKFHIDNEKNLFDGQDLVVEPLNTIPEPGGKP
jgi:hypothetical protein